MLKNLSLIHFRFDKGYRKTQRDEFLADAFADPVFLQHLRVLSKDGTLQPLASSSPSSSSLSLRTAIPSTLIPATLTNLSLFDRLVSLEPPVVRPSGGILPCMEMNKNGYRISNRLQAMLARRDMRSVHDLDEEEEEEEVEGGKVDKGEGQAWSPVERSELLVQLFRHLVLGGAMNQYEDALEPYIEVTKRIYKSLIDVQKTEDGEGIEVASVVYRIDDASLFPHATLGNNFCYAIVNHVKRHVSILYYASAPFW